MGATAWRPASVNKGWSADQAWVRKEDTSPLISQKGSQ